MTAGWWDWVCCSHTYHHSLGDPTVSAGCKCGWARCWDWQREPPTCVTPPPSKNWHLMRAQGTLCSACVGLACVQPCTPSRAVLVPLWALSCSWSLAWQSCVWVVKASVPCRTGGGELCDVEEDTCQRS